LDDVVNFIPARLNGLLFVTAAWISCNDARGAWRIMFRDHRKTASPNGGWTMGAMAGALEVQLEKLNYYKLGDPQKKLLPGTIKASVTIMMLTAAVWTLVLIIGQVGYHVLTQT